MINTARILLVEDDESIRTLLEMALVDEGYNVTTANNGAKALALISECRPHLILLDMRMPVMDGAQFVAEYHQSHGRQVPIILLTASGDPDTTETGSLVAYTLAKPFDLIELLEQVEVLLPKNA